MKRSITLVLILLFGPVFGSSPVLSLNNQEEPIQAPLIDKELQKLDEEQTAELKLDLPKFDKTVPKKRVPLKGSVQHQEVIKGRAEGEGTSEGGTGKFDGNARQSKLDGSARTGGFRGGLTKNGSNDEMGLGIIGVKFVMVFGRTPIIYEVFPGTPAAEVGMRPRDIILAVDGIPTAGLSKDEVYNMIVGPPNTPVTISFKRKNDFEVRQIMRMDLNKIGNPLLRRDYLRM